MAESMEEEPCQQPLLLQLELTCPVCQGVYRDPVVLPCSHSFCRECLQANLQFTKKCPLCRALFREEQVISNRALSNACETFLRESYRPPVNLRNSQDTCNLHLRPLELYCEKDEEPLCVECVSLHNTHHMVPLREGAKICTKELDFKVKIFQKKVESYKKLTNNLNDAVEHIKFQAGVAEKQINEEFERLHDLLYKEKNQRIQALATEEEQKIAAIQEQLENASMGIASLNGLIDTLKKEMGNEDLALLRNFQDLKRKAQWPNEDPGFPADPLLNMGEHVGALDFKIWKSLQAHVKYYPVLLDPNSASPWLELKADLTSVNESSERLAIPENPERFDPCVFVLGAEGYTSGKHKWDVFVGDTPKWIVGVCKESVVRKKKFTISTNRGVWAIGLSKGMYTVLTPDRTELQLQQRPEMIRIKLNIDKGEVSFWDGGAAKHLVTLNHKFDEKMFPIFGPGLHSSPMTLVPGKIAVHTS